MYTLKNDKTKVEVELSINAEEWEAGVQKVYESTKGKYNAVGFRKGHAPRKVIESTYGDSVFFEDTVNFFVEKTINEVLDENAQLEPVAMPTTQFESYTKDGGLKMKIIFEVVPDFKLCKYKGVDIKVHSAEVTDADIDAEIKRFLNEHKKFSTVDREVKNGDNVLIDFMGFINDVEFEGGSAKDYALEIGSHSFIDTFEDQLIGHKKGETVDVKVKFPENYFNEELSGQMATFKVVIKEVRETVVPTLDDNFISNATEFETVEEYRKDLIAHIQTMKQNDQEAEFEYNMRDYLIQNTKDLQIPDAMVEQFVHHDLHNMQHTLEMYKMTLAEYVLRMGFKTIDEYVEHVKQQTLRSTQIRYIYRKIIEENKLQVPAEELAKATEGMTEREDIVRKENELTLQILYKFLADNNNKVITDED